MKPIAYILALSSIFSVNNSYSQDGLLELLCVGGFVGELDRKEFQLSIIQNEGFMWGFDPVVAIGFFNVDDKKIPFTKDFKCNKLESAFICSGQNSIGFSSAELSRYTGILKISTFFRRDKVNLKSEFKCDTPPKKKF
jgi:hypothetical protein